MKRKIIYTVAMVYLLFSMTGCVKYNATMDIKKDKSMDFSIIYAVDTSLTGDEPMFGEEQIAEYEKQGFEVEDYKEGNMEGVTLRITYDNIDKVSTEEDTEYSLSALGDEEAGYLFKVEKGLLKNKYIASFDFDTSDSALDDSEEEVEVEDYDYFDEESYEYDEEEFVNPFENFSAESMTQNLDLSLSVKLPYSALSENADEVSNDSKELKWVLLTEGDNEIEFSFELYNMTNIYMGVGAGIALLTVIVVAALMLIKNKKTTKE